MNFILNTILKLYLKKVYSNALLSPKELLKRQKKTWSNIQTHLKMTELGKKYELTQFVQWEAYKNKFPILTYSELEPFIMDAISGKKNSIMNDAIIKVGLTSGTTGKHGKKIPYNLNMIKLFNKARLFNLSCLLNEQPNLLNEPPYTLSIAASNEVYKEGNVSFGYISGIINEFEPSIMKGLFFPKAPQLNLLSWSEKVELIYKQTKNIDLKIIAGIPAILIEVLDSLCEFYKVNSLAAIFPNLKICFYGGTDIHLYRERLNTLCGRELFFYPIYTATEAPIGLPLRSTKNLSYYLLNPHLIFHFIDKNNNSTYLDVTELRLGETYGVLLTAPNGLLKYPLGDEIKVESLSPYFTFSLVGRSGGGLNLATEKISEDKLLKAVEKTMDNLNINYLDRPTHFCLTSYQGQHQLGYHFILFFKPIALGTIKSLEQKLEVELDQVLCEQNQDYREFRASRVLGAAKVSCLEAERLTQYLRDTSQQGQIKIPIVFKDKNLLVQYMKDKLNYNIEEDLNLYEK